MFHKLLYSLGVLSVFANCSFGDVTVQEAVEIAFQGTVVNEKTQSITVRAGRNHGFYLPPFTVKRNGNEVIAEGYFRHRHKGQDDQFHFRIVATRDSYSVTVTKIVYRGWVSKALLGLYNSNGRDGINAVIQRIEKNRPVQARFDGKWERAALKVCDVIGVRLQQEAARSAS